MPGVIRCVTVAAKLSESEVVLVSALVSVKVGAPVSAREVVRAFVSVICATALTVGRDTTVLCAVAVGRACCITASAMAAPDQFISTTWGERSLLAAVVATRKGAAMTLLAWTIAINITRGPTVTLNNLRRIFPSDSFHIPSSSKPLLHPSDCASRSLYIQMLVDPNGRAFVTIRIFYAPFATRSTWHMPHLIHFFVDTLLQHTDLLNCWYKNTSPRYCQGISSYRCTIRPLIDATC